MLYGLMLGLVVIILALALAPTLQEFTGNAMNQTVGDTIGLDCDNVTISNFDKATCVATDLSMFYFIGFMLFLGASLITAKLVFS